MTDAPPPPPPPDRHVTRWKAATAVVAALGLAASGGVYLAMDQRLDDLHAERDATREELAEAREEGGLGDLGELLGGLGENGLGGLEDLLGEGGLGELLGEGSGGFDPILMECLGQPGFGESAEPIPDGGVREQVAAIQEIIAAERGLPAGDEVDVEFVSLDEVRRRAVELTREELDPARAEADSRFLAALGAVEPGADLVQTQLDALDAGVAGFYNPESERLVIGSEEMDGLGMLITAHELVHAMADAELGLPDQERIAAEDGADAAYAALNAIEGDASLYSQQFIGKRLPITELLALQAASANTTADLDKLPHFVARQLEFPYLEGMTFTCDLFLDGGWEAVDATYDAPPTTTAQVLFPDRYRSGEQAEDVSDRVGPSGWDELRKDTFGAADLLFLLEAPGGDEGAALSDPKERVQAWAGGEFTVWGRGEETATSVVLADRGGATPLCQTMADFYAAAFPDAARSERDGAVVFEGRDQHAVVACGGDEVALGIGPDFTTARTAISKAA